MLLLPFLIYLSFCFLKVIWNSFSFMRSCRKNKFVLVDVCQNRSLFKFLNFRFNFFFVIFYVFFRWCLFFLSFRYLFLSLLLLLLFCYLSSFHNFLSNLDAVLLIKQEDFLKQHTYWYPKLYSSKYLTNIEQPLSAKNLHTMSSGSPCIT